MEIFLAWLGNVQIIAMILLACLTLVLFIMLGPLEMYDSKDGRANLLRMGKVMAVCAAVASVPSPADLWRTRLSLLKLDLASPANVGAAAEHIEEVVKALECKHLGVNCPKPEKEAK